MPMIKQETERGHQGRKIEAVRALRNASTRGTSEGTCRGDGRGGEGRELEVEGLERRLPVVKGDGRVDERLDRLVPNRDPSSNA